MLYLSVLSAVSHHGLENEIYFKCSSLEINSFASWLKKRGIFHISCTCLSWGLIVHFTTGLRVHLMDFIGIRWIPMKSIGQHLYPTWFSPNFRYPFVLWISVILEGVTSRSFLIPWENLVYSMESICMFWTCVTNTQPTMYLFSWHTLLKGIWEVFWCVVSDQKGKGNVLTAIVSLLSFCLTRVKLWSLAQHWNDTAFGVCGISLY